MDRDLSSYERDVIEHLLFGMARSRIFEDVSAGKPWNVDLGTSELRIGGQVYESQMLGSYAPGPRTFLWSWANPSAPEWAASLHAVAEVRALGAKPGYAVFREGEVPASWVDPRELAFVAGELTGGHPVYVANAGGAAVFLIVGTPVDPRTISPVYLRRILTDFQSISSADKPTCIARFLARLELQVERSNARLSGKRGDGTRVAVEFDEQGRIAKVDVTAHGKPIG